MKQNRQNDIDPTKLDSETLRSKAVSSVANLVTNKTITPIQAQMLLGQNLDGKDPNSKIYKYIDGFNKGGESKVINGAYLKAIIKGELDKGADIHKWEQPLLITRKPTNTAYLNDGEE